MRRYIERDALVEEFKELYPPFVAKIVDLLTRVQANDKKLSRLHQARPSGEPLRLREVEMEARGIDRLGFYDLSIVEHLKLPTWEPGAALAWPPPTPPLMVMPANFSLPFAATPEQVAERDRLRREEIERAAAQHAARQREYEEREVRAAREATERERKEHLRRHGWG